MESVHIIFYGKKIQGLVDEGFHDSLKFENKVKGMNYDNNDEDEQE